MIRSGVGLAASVIAISMMAATMGDTFAAPPDKKAAPAAAPARAAPAPAARPAPPPRPAPAPVARAAPPPRPAPVARPAPMARPAPAIARPAAPHMAPRIAAPAAGAANAARPAFGPRNPTGRADVAGRKPYRAASAECAIQVARAEPCIQRHFATRSNKQPKARACSSCNRGAGSAAPNGASSTRCNAPSGRTRTTKPADDHRIGPVGSPAAIAVERPAEPRRAARVEHATARPAAERPAEPADDYWIGRLDFACSVAVESPAEPR